MTRFSHIGALALLVFVAAGCNLPGIPLDFGERRDTGATPDGGTPAERVCEPDSRTCLTSSTVQICSADGTDFRVETCGDGTCTDGVCLPIENTCRRGQPFALTPTEVVFDVREDFKNQVRQVRLDNCGTHRITVRDISIRGPSRPDGHPVFELSETSATAGELEPGSSLTFGVIYRPTRGLSQVRGRLELGIITDSFANYGVELRARSYCATVSPAVDFGVVSTEETATMTSYLQNCGTDPLTLSTVITSAKESSTFWSLTPNPGEKVPSTIHPGENVPITLRLEPKGSGLLRDDLLIGFEETSVPPLNTPIVAALKRPGCEKTIPAPSVRTTVRNILVEGDPIVARPLEIVRFMGSRDDAILHATPVTMAKRSHTRIHYDEGATPYFRPTVIGDYTFALRTFVPATGEISCDATNVTVRLRPEAPLYVELVWSSDDDVILGDAGFGRGVNLDLHVLAATDDAEWNDEDDDCFFGADYPCGAAEGHVRSHSKSGDVAEIITFDEPRDYRFKLGVYLSNPFNFKDVSARVRIFRDGELAGELGTSRLQMANDFWLVGQVEVAEETDIDFTDVVTTGFPK